MKTPTATIIATLLAPICVYSQVYDVVADFSSSANPAGPWSYGQASTLGGTFSLLSTPLSIAGGQLDGWGTPGTFPFVLVNSTGGSVTDGTTVYPDASVAVHPSSSGEYSILRWTAPFSGQFSISVAYSDIPNDEVATVDVHALRNGVSFFDSSLGTETTTGYSTGSMSLSSGDVIDFAVGFGSGASYAFDHTAVQASITAVPEPEHYAACAAAGLLAFGLWRRTSRNA